MDILNFSTYLCSASVCFSMAMVLFALNKSGASENLSYRSIKFNIALSALIDVAVDIMALFLLLRGKSIVVLDCFIVPTAYFAQLFLMTKSMFGLIHFFPKFNLKNYWFLIPFFLTCFVYWIGFIFEESEEVSGGFLQNIYESYLDYTHSGLARLCSYIIYAMIGLGLVQASLVLIRRTIKFLRKLNNYYSGTDAIEGRKISYISYCFLSYFALAAVDFVFSDDDTKPYFLMVNTFIFILAVIVVANMEAIYTTTRHLDYFDIDNQNEVKELLKATGDEEEAGNDAGDDDKNEEIDKDTEFGIVSTIHAWERLDNKPYLKDGILIADVANDLGLTAVQLSFILNHSMKMNFNTWINTLRVEESKRLIEKNKERSLVRIAYSSGFTDSASFSRTFKKIVGVTPTEYRKSLKK